MQLRDIYFPPAATAPGHPFIEIVSTVLESVGEKPAIDACTAASELAWYAEAGISGTIFGPGRIARAHCPDEYVDVDQLRAACTYMALTAARWCGIRA